MYGLFIKWLLTGKFRTHNPFYLLAITLIGVLCGGLPTIIILYEIIVLGNWSILRLTIDRLLVLTISDLLLINAILSIVNWNGKPSPAIEFLTCDIERRIIPIIQE
jgi:hypothetical protein